MRLREIRIACFYFWKGFRFEELNVRFPSLGRKYRLVHDQERPDIALFSVFSGERFDIMPPPPNIGVPTVFMTGENVVPDMDRCDVAISFRRDIPSPRHMRIPNWVPRMHLAGFPPRTLLFSERLLGERGDRFCLFLYRNRVQFREDFFRRLSTRKRVDAPGISMNNMPAIGGGIADKLTVQKRYRVTIAFENAASPGYTTEKIVESFCAGSLPIYWGDPTVHLDFNRDAFLNLADFASADDVIDAVMNLEDDERAWRDMMQQPVFAGDTLPACADDDRIFAFLEPIFDAALSARPTFRQRLRKQRHQTQFRVRLRQSKQPMRVPDGLLRALNYLTRQRIFSRLPPAIADRDHRRFLLIKAWGCGFWSDMSHVLGCLLLAEISGRVPVTYWGRNSLYRDGTGSDAFRLYFEPVSPFTIDDIEASAAHSFFPPKWSATTLRRENNAKFRGAYSRLTGSRYLDRSETVAVSDFYIHVPDLTHLIPTTHEWHGKPYREVYRLLAQRFLRPVPGILASIDEFYQARMSGAQPIIAVHVRGTDKFYEAENAPGLQAYFDIIDRDAPGWPIFLLTDQTQYVEAFCARYGSRVIFTDAQRSSTQTPVHQGLSANRVRLGIDVVVDTYLALRCQKFIGLGKSNPSCLVSVLKDWGPGECALFGPTLLEMNFARRLGRE